MFGKFPTVWKLNNTLPNNHGSNYKKSEKVL